MQSKPNRSIAQNYPSYELRFRMNLPEESVYTHVFDCALPESILLQGNLYVFNTAISFHSLSSRYSTTGTSDTLLVIPYRQIINIKKKELLQFKESIQIDTVNESIILTSFLNRDQVYKIIQDSKAAWLKIELFTPCFFSQFSQINEKDQPYHFKNEVQIWLSKAIQSIANNSKQEEQINEQTSNQQTKQVSIQQQTTSDSQQKEEEGELEQDNNNQNVDSATQIENELFNKAYIRNISHLSNEDVATIQDDEIIPQELKQQPQNLGDQDFNNGLEIAQSNEVSTKNQNDQQEQAPLILPGESQDTMNTKNTQSNEELEPAQQSQGSLEKNQEEQKLANEQNENIDQTQMNPLEIQKSCLKDLDEYSAKYKDQFDAREMLSLSTVSKDFNTTDTIEIILPLMSAREVFCLFFSNQIFQRRDKTYNSFVEYYVLEHLHGEGLTVSEISPPPPEVFQSVYSNNFAQLLDFQITSDRLLSFAHPTQSSSMFLPKSLNCTMKEQIYWSSPQSFLITRIIHLKGGPGVGSFEPMIVFMISERDKDVVLRYGFKINFKGTTMFKTKIEEAAMEECKKNWNEIKNLIVNISQEHKDKRDANKWIDSKINPKFEIPCDLTSFEVPDYEEEEEQDEDGQVEDQHKNQNKNLPLIKNKDIIKDSRKSQKQNGGAAKIQQEQFSQDQRILYGQDLGNVAAKASKESCIIF